MAIGFCVAIRAAISMEVPVGTEPMSVRVSVRGARHIEGVVVGEYGVFGWGLRRASKPLLYGLG